MYVCVYIYIYIYTHFHIYIYIYIHALGEGAGPVPADHGGRGLQRGVCTIYISTDIYMYPTHVSVGG